MDIIKIYTDNFYLIHISSREEGLFPLHRGKTAGFLHKRNGETEGIPSC